MLGTDWLLENCSAEKTEGSGGQQAKHKWQHHSLGDKQCSGLRTRAQTRLRETKGQRIDRSLAGPSSDQIWNTAPVAGLSSMRKCLISFRKANQQGYLCLEHMNCDKNLKQSGFSSLKEESCMWMWQTNLPTLQSKTPPTAARFFDEVDMVKWNKDTKLKWEVSTR